MKLVLRVFLALCLLVASSLASAAFPSLKLPFPSGEAWTMTRGYETLPTHKDYGGAFSDDRYALDFAFGNCDQTYGKTILAAASGTVVAITRTEKQSPDSKGGYGNSIVIDHGDGYSTRYAHLKSIKASVARYGAPVNQGQEIGAAGGTGNVVGSACVNTPGVEGVHLHFVLYRNGDGVKPEPMSGYGSFSAGNQYTSTNSQQSPAASVTALSCIYVSSTQQFCWRSSSTSNVLCPAADAWILYNYSNNSSSNKLASDCQTYCTAANQYCMDGTGSHSVDGFGVGGGDSFNLKLDFDIMDPVSGVEWIAGQKDLVPGQVVNLKVQVQAVSGNTSSHMRPGKDRIEVDYYYRTGGEEWTFLVRQYIQATNLPSGGTHTETVQYTIPQGISQISFKVKIDAEDEAYEVNESDNWSRTENFTVFYRRSLKKLLEIIED